MNFSVFHRQKDRFDSKLFDQTNFYSQFTKDLKNCKFEVINESPVLSIR